MGGYDVPPGTSPALRSPAYGTWKREPGVRNDSFRQLGCTSDATGAFSGSTEVSGRLDRAHGSGAFTSISSASFFDAAGNLVRTGCGTATGLRF